MCTPAEAWKLEASPRRLSPSHQPTTSSGDRHSVTFLHPEKDFRCFASAAPAPLSPDPRTASTRPSPSSSCEGASSSQPRSRGPQSGQPSRGGRSPKPFARSMGASGSRLETKSGPLALLVLSKLSLLILAVSISSFDGTYWQPDPRAREAGVPVLDSSTTSLLVSSPNHVLTVSLALFLSLLWSLKSEAFSRISTPFLIGSPIKDQRS